MLAPSPDLVVVVDSREQRPYHFPRFVVAALETGDYSVQGLEGRIAIERKSLVDCYSTLGARRDRFRCEFERMACMDYAAVVVESDLPGFLIPPARSGIHPNAALGTLLAWSVRHGVHVHFASDRRHGNALVLRLLEYFYRENQGRKDRGRKVYGGGEAGSRSVEAGGSAKDGRG